MTVGSGNALDAMSKYLIRNHENRGIDFSYFCKNEINPNHYLNQEEIEEVRSADVIVIQGTWGSDHPSRKLKHYLDGMITRDAWMNEFNQRIADIADELEKTLIVLESATYSRTRNNYFLGAAYKNIKPTYYRMGARHWTYSKGLWCDIPNDYNRLKRYKKEVLLNHRLEMSRSEEPEHDKDGSILILPGCEDDPTSSRPVKEWVEATVEQIKSQTDRWISIKPHPGSSLDFSHLVDTQTSIVRDMSLLDLASTTFAAVMDNSTSIFELVDLNIPCFTSSSNFGAAISETDLANIESPRLPTVEEKREWARKMSFTEFSIDEFADGRFMHWLEQLISLDSSIPRSS